MNTLKVGTKVVVLRSSFTRRLNLSGKVGVVCALERGVDPFTKKQMMFYKVKFAKKIKPRGYKSFWLQCDDIKPIS